MEKKRNSVAIVDGKFYLQEVKSLIIEYTDSLHRDLTFQNLAQELEHLEDKYENSRGKMLAALSETGEVVGCVAYHRWSEIRCEMKRLYVRPKYREHGTGEQLAKAILQLAKEDGYQEMVLDTLKPLQSAIALYHKLGFTETEAYYHNPMPDVVYMKKRLI